HQLKRAIVRELVRGKRRQLQRALVDPEKHKFAMGAGFAPVALQQILKALIGTPEAGQERKLQRNQDEPDAPRADSPQDRQSMAGDAVHVRIIKLQSSSSKSQ